MTTIKSYTDIPQSKKLTEFLPIESADMEYLAIKETGKLIAGVPFVKDDSEVEDSAYSHIYDRISCWSLAALLGVLPNENMLVKTTDGEYYCLAKDVMTKHYDNPVDACYEMVLKLHKLNLLLL